jgi:uncharacterized coiled-coil protein SlyX
MRNRSRNLVGSFGVSALLLTSAGAIAQTAPTPVSVGSAGAPATADSMARLTQEIRALNSDIMEVVRRVSQLQFTKPGPPAKDASEDARNRYSQDLATWQSEVSSLQARINQLEARTKMLQARLDKLSQTLPAAQSADRDKNEKALRDGQKRLEGARTNLSASATPAYGKPPIARPVGGLPTPAPPSSP